MLLKIISGGQTGVDRAALDAAIKVGIPHGGWIPKGRLTEEGPLPPEYEMRETDSIDYADRTARNIEAADATLLISCGPLDGGSALTLRLAKKGKPCLHVDLTQQAAFQAAVIIRRWLFDNRIEILNIAGPRASKDPQIYSKALKMLETVLYLELIHSDPAKAGQQFASSTDQETISAPLPTRLAEAVDRMISEMGLKDRVTLANMAEIELASLTPTLGSYVLNRFELDGSNTQLLEACRWDAGSLKMPPGEAAAMIIRSAWKKLQSTHKLRVIPEPDQN